MQDGKTVRNSVDILFSTQLGCALGCVVLEWGAGWLVLVPAPGFGAGTCFTLALGARGCECTRILKADVEQVDGLVCGHVAVGEQRKRGAVQAAREEHGHMRSPAAWSVAMFATRRCTLSASTARKPSRAASKSSSVDAGCCGRSSRRRSGWVKRDWQRGSARGVVGDRSRSMAQMVAQSISSSVAPGSLAIESSRAVLATEQMVSASWRGLRWRSSDLRPSGSRAKTSVDVCVSSSASAYGASTSASAAFTACSHPLPASTRVVMRSSSTCASFSPASSLTRDDEAPSTVSKICPFHASSSRPWVDASGCAVMPTPRRLSTLEASESAYGCECAVKWWWSVRRESGPRRRMASSTVGHTWSCAEDAGAMAIPMPHMPE